MSEANDTLNGSEVIGGRDPKSGAAALGLQIDEFTQNSQSEPLPVCFGSVRRSGIHLMPLFGLRAEPVKTKTGK